MTALAVVTFQMLFAVFQKIVSLCNSQTTVFRCSELTVQKSTKNQSSFEQEDLPQEVCSQITGASVISSCVKHFHQNVLDKLSQGYIKLGFFQTKK